MKENGILADVLNFVLILAGLVGFAVINFFINGGPELFQALGLN